LILEFFSVELTEKKVYIDYMSILSILLNIESGYHSNVLLKIEVGGLDVRNGRSKRGPTEKKLEVSDGHAGW
jgi:hypothetical protein